MPPLAQIVVGVDGRPTGWDGLALAQRFARVGDGRLTVVCAYPELGYAHAPLHWNGVGDPAAAQAVLDAAHERVAPDARVEYCAIVGAHPGACLQSVARTTGAGLLVLGGAEHGGVGRALGGSVLANVLVDPPCAIAVPPRGHGGAAHGLRRIGVAVDGSAQALAALRWAEALADAHDEVCELRLLAVDEHDEAPAAVAASRRGELLGTHGARPGVAVRWLPLPGSVADELREASGHLDLLVVGTHGRGPVAQLLHGSVSRGVAEEARCPVVAVPAA